MKNTIFFLLLFFAKITFAQEKMITNSGIINFEASVPYFEEIKAKNEMVQCVLNTKTGEISSVVLMKDFHFKLLLMEEHFNQKYLETDSYPNAYFKGTIEGFNLNIIDSNSKEFKLKGELKIHGKTKKINTIVALRKSENKMEIVSNFNVNIKDFNIKIPEILSMKIAETVTIRTIFWVQ